MSEWTSQACETCAKPVIKVIDFYGTEFFVDANPRDRGTYALSLIAAAAPPLAVKPSAHLAFGRQLYAPHIDNCRTTTAKPRPRKRGRS